MKLEDFYQAVSDHPDLSGYMSLESKQVGIKHAPTGLSTLLDFDAIEKHTWALLLSILVGEREAGVLYHMSRIVGYYSRTDNWNPSKLAEMRDRQAGNYSIPV